MQKCVWFEILHLFVSLWDLGSVETRGLGLRPSQGGLGVAEPPQAEKVLTDFIYFETVSFTTSDVY